jgi:hypothetical protein
VALSGYRYWNLRAAEGGFVSEGNRGRLRWRAMCAMLSKTEGVSPWERAVFGVLGGDESAAALKCESWEDHCWRRFRVSADARLEAAVAAVSLAPRAGARAISPLTRAAAAAARF